jgi:putative MATE family efflux protein
VFLNQVVTGGLQSLLFTSLVFVDVYLTGQLGDAEVAAVGIAGQSLWLISMVLFGIGSGAGMFFAQCFGRDDAEGFRSVFKTSLFISLAIALPATLLFALLPREILSYVVNDAEVINFASSYLQVAAATLITGALILAIDYLFRAINNPKVPLIGGVLEVVVNVVISFVLVFGWYGFPEMGVVGAAWGSLIGRLLRVALLFYYLSRHEDYVRVFEINWLTLPKLTQVRRYLFKALPLMFNAAIWAVGIYLYSYIFAQISVEALAAWNTLIPMQELCLSLLAGVSSAAGMTVGQSLGSNNTDEAWYRAKYSTGFSFALGCVMSAVVLLLSDFYVNCFTGITDATKAVVASSVTVIAITMPINALNRVMFTGILRAGGANAINLASDITANWLVALPLAFYAAFYLQWDVIWIVVILLAAEGVKVLFWVYYFFSKRWLMQLEV